VAPARTTARFYRTSAGAEIDLVLDIPGRGRWAIEIKRSLSARPKKGFHLACQDIEPDQRFLVYPGDGNHPAGADIEIIGLKELLTSWRRLGAHFLDEVGCRAKRNSPRLRRFFFTQWGCGLRARSRAA